MSRPIFCSFCGKDSKDVERMIAGPRAFICNECVAISSDIIAGRTKAKPFPTDEDEVPQPINPGIFQKLTKFIPSMH